MESLNLNTLASTLPTPYQSAEKDLLNNFKAAALSITTLYRSSRHASKRAYNAGYASACNDLLMMIQQGVSVGGIDASGPESSHGSGGMTIGKVMDWIEARMEAIKSREEEEDEEEEKEKDRERGRNSGSTAPAPTSSKPDVKAATKTEAVASTSGRSTREQPQVSAAPAPNSPRQHGNAMPSQSSSPSPPPTILRQTQRTAKLRSAAAKGELIPQTTSPNVDFPSQSPFSLVSPESMPAVASLPMATAVTPYSEVAAGAKRRHAVMMMLDSASSPSSMSGGSSASSPNSTPAALAGTRRRTRSSRNLTNGHGFIQSQALNLASEAMEVEEDVGRERKRVARR